MIDIGPINVVRVRIIKADFRIKGDTVLFCISDNRVHISPSIVRDIDGVVRNVRHFPVDIVRNFSSSLRRGIHTADRDKILNVEEISRATFTKTSFSNTFICNNVFLEGRIIPYNDTFLGIRDGEVNIFCSCGNSLRISDICNFCKAYSENSTENGAVAIPVCKENEIISIWEVSQRNRLYRTLRNIAGKRRYSRNRHGAR